ncbi:MAG: 23S rRNA (guanosine(2251)-2'-O)-methyltransferase RlmB [Synergistaceae bacterium]|nr:23S rRNA (guanosine(2251)-2'-O)-methyltransferase RlmB [Synergistaceae bacterium]
MIEQKQKNNEAREIIFGRNAVLSLLESRAETVTRVLVSKTIKPHIKSEVLDACRASKIPFDLVENSLCEKYAPSQNHQGVVAFATPVASLDLEDLIKILPPTPNKCLLIVCDHLEDPHNLGAIIRTAETAGASGVIIPKRGGVSVTGVVIKVSAGAATRVPVARITNVANTLKRLQEENFWVTALDMDGRDTLFKEDLPPRSVLVVGAEGNGVSQAAKKSCDDVRFIPMAGNVGSLNASVAAALAIYEWVRSTNNT